MSYFQQLRVVPGTNAKFREIDPEFKGEHQKHQDALAELEHYQKRLRELQELLYAERKRSLLICLQAMDTGGKDGTINHVLAAMNPQGCRVAGFRKPSVEELSHDFLWRAHKVAPARGEVVIFNRSHYEDVLVTRVHQLVSEKACSKRYDRINEFEQELIDHDTHVLKFFLHISKAEQLKRFGERLSDPTKQWKISESDYEERKYWDQYMSAFEEALSRCSTEQAPWFIIPANHKWFRNLAVAKIVVEHLEGLKMTYPTPQVDLQEIGRKYHAENGG